MKKDNQRQGMSELLAKQRAGPSLTPSEAARQRRSGRHQSAPGSARTPLEDRPAPGPQPPGDLPSAEETPAEAAQAIRDQPGESAEAVAQMEDHASAGAGIISQAGAGPVRSAVSRAARNKGTLLAVTCAVVVPVVCWLMAGRLRRARALAADQVRTWLRDCAR